EDGPVKFEKLQDEGGEGYNHWYRLVLKEGRNRVVRRTFEALGLPVSRLMRVRFGIVNLPPRLKRGMLAELGPGEVAAIFDWAGMQKPLAENRRQGQADRPVAKAGGERKREKSDQGALRGKPAGARGAARRK
ncbi:MAG: pseudouridine synthase, partial [Gallionellaceae bacterium]|nr:pseudouridine synthase [Gallionellaceae bacterium]